MKDSETGRTPAEMAHAAVGAYPSGVSILCTCPPGAAGLRLLNHRVCCESPARISVPSSCLFLPGDSMVTVASRNANTNALQELLRKAGGCVVIDGGLATQLERRGADISGPLWSAICLLTMPDIIRQVHVDYLEAGAEVLITASYQATLQGFKARGISSAEGEALMRRSVELAVEARQSFLSSATGARSSAFHRHPLVAASVGSYGAYLADGSEYSGNYGPAVAVDTLKDFHRRRLQVLAEAQPDLLAIETIPSKLEAQALIELLEEERFATPAWISFNSTDGVRVPAGDLFSDCAALAEKCDKVVAIGINCTPPRFIHGLISAARQVTSKPIVVYPNSGETWDAKARQWLPHSGVSDCGFVAYVDEWRNAGASLIGGCCRTTPETIRAISERISLPQSEIELRQTAQLYAPVSVTEADQGQAVRV